MINPRALSRQTVAAVGPAMRALATEGWRVHGWEMGVNWGARADTVARLGQRLDQISKDEKVLLVGWSLGGLFAREVARAGKHESERRRIIVVSINLR